MSFWSVIEAFVFSTGQLTPPILVVTNVTATMATITHTHPPTLIPDYHLLTLSMGMVGGCNHGNTNNLTFFLDPNEASFTISNLEEVDTPLHTHTHTHTLSLSLSIKGYYICGDCSKSEWNVWRQFCQSATVIYHI